MAYYNLVTKAVIARAMHWNVHLSRTCETHPTYPGEQELWECFMGGRWWWLISPLCYQRERVWAFVWFPRQPSNIDFIILWWFACCHSWEIRLLGSPCGCRVLLLIMSAKDTWTGQEPQLGHFEIITLDLCLQSSWTGAGSCPSEEKQSRCTTVSTCRTLSSDIRQATNLFLLAPTCKKVFLHIRKLWFLVFICLSYALTYSSSIFRKDCNCNVL